MYLMLLFVYKRLLVIYLLIHLLLLFLLILNHIPLVDIVFHKNQLNINLSENNLADYRFQIQKDVVKVFGKDGLKGDVKTVEGLISNRNLSLILLGVSVFWAIYFVYQFFQ